MAVHPPSSAEPPAIPDCKVVSAKKAKVTIQREGRAIEVDGLIATVRLKNAGASGTLVTVPLALEGALDIMQSQDVEEEKGGKKRDFITNIACKLFESLSEEQFNAMRSGHGQIVATKAEVNLVIGETTISISRQAAGKTTRTAETTSHKYFTTQQHVTALDYIFKQNNLTYAARVAAIDALLEPLGRDDARLNGDLSNAILADFLHVRNDNEFIHSALIHLRNHYASLNGHEGVSAVEQGRKLQTALIQYLQNHLVTRANKPLSEVPPAATPQVSSREELKPDERRKLDADLRAVFAACGYPESELNKLAPHPTLDPTLLINKYGEFNGALLGKSFHLHRSHGDNEIPLQQIHAVLKAIDHNGLRMDPKLQHALRSVYHRGCIEFPFEPKHIALPPWAYGFPPSLKELQAILSEKLAADGGPIQLAAIEAILAPLPRYNEHLDGNARNATYTDILHAPNKNNKRVHEALITIRNQLREACSLQELPPKDNSVVQECLGKIKRFMKDHLQWAGTVATLPTLQSVHLLSNDEMKVLDTPLRDFLIKQCGFTRKELASLILPNGLLVNQYGEWNNEVLFTLFNPSMRHGSAAYSPLQLLHHFVTERRGEFAQPLLHLLQSTYHVACIASDTDPSRISKIEGPRDNLSTMDWAGGLWQEVFVGSTVGIDRSPIAPSLNNLFVSAARYVGYLGHTPDSLRQQVVDHLKLCKNGHDIQRLFVEDNIGEQAIDLYLDRLAAGTIAGGKAVLQALAEVCECPIQVDEVNEQEDTAFSTRRYVPFGTRETGQAADLPIIRQAVAKKEEPEPPPPIALLFDQDRDYYTVTPSVNPLPFASQLLQSELAAVHQLYNLGQRIQTAKGEELTSVVAEIRQFFLSKDLSFTDALEIMRPNMLYLHDWVALLVGMKDRIPPTEHALRTIMQDLIDSGLADLATLVSIDGVESKLGRVDEKGQLVSPAADVRDDLQALHDRLQRNPQVSALLSAYTTLVHPDWAPFSADALNDIEQLILWLTQPPVLQGPSFTQGKLLEFNGVNGMIACSKEIGRIINEYYIIDQSKRHGPPEGDMELLWNQARWLLANPSENDKLLGSDETLRKLCNSIGLIYNVAYNKAPPSQPLKTSPVDELLRSPGPLPPSPPTPAPPPPDAQTLPPAPRSPGPPPPAIIITPPDGSEATRSTASVPVAPPAAVTSPSRIPSPAKQPAAPLRTAAAPAAPPAAPPQGPTLPTAPQPLPPAPPQGGSAAGAPPPPLTAASLVPLAPQGGTPPPPTPPQAAPPPVTQTRTAPAAASQPPPSLTKSMAGVRPSATTPSTPKAQTPSVPPLVTALQRDETPSAYYERISRSLLQIPAPKGLGAIQRVILGLQTPPPVNLQRALTLLTALTEIPEMMAQMSPDQDRQLGYHGQLHMLLDLLERSKAFAPLVGAISVELDKVKDKVITGKYPTGPALSVAQARQKYAASNDKTTPFMSYLDAIIQDETNLDWADKMINEILANSVPPESVPIAAASAAPPPTLPSAAPPEAAAPPPPPQSPRAERPSSPVHALLPEAQVPPPAVAPQAAPTEFVVVQTGEALAAFCDRVRDYLNTGMPPASIFQAIQEQIVTLQAQAKGYAPKPLRDALHLFTIFRGLPDRMALLGDDSEAQVNQLDALARKVAALPDEYAGFKQSLSQEIAAARAIAEAGLFTALSTTGLTANILDAPSLSTLEAQVRAIPSSEYRTWCENRIQAGGDIVRAATTISFIPILRGAQEYLANLDKTNPTVVADRDKTISSLDLTLGQMQRTRPQYIQALSDANYSLLQEMLLLLKLQIESYAPDVIRTAPVTQKDKRMPADGNLTPANLHATVDKLRLPTPNQTALTTFNSLGARSHPITPPPDPLPPDYIVTAFRAMMQRLQVLCALGGEPEDNPLNSLVNAWNTTYKLLPDQIRPLIASVTKQYLVAHTKDISDVCSYLACKPPNLI